MKACLTCKETKELSLFHRNKNMKDGRSSYCAECTAKRHQARKNLPGNAEYNRRKTRNWYKDNPYRLSMQSRQVRVGKSLLNNPVFSEEEYNERLKEIYQIYIDKATSQDEIDFINEELARFLRGTQ